MIIIVFGLAAAGKNYVGKVIAKYFDCHYEDADQWLLDEMKQCILAKQNFTIPMLSEFTNKVIGNIKNLKQKYSNLVISQAFYRSDNREAILKNFPNEDLIFIQVNASDEVILERLKRRGDWVCPEYAAGMRKYFEEMDNALVINNNLGESEILEQLNRHFKKKNIGL